MFDVLRACLSGAGLQRCGVQTLYQGEAQGFALIVSSMGRFILSLHYLLQYGLFSLLANVEELLR